MMVGKLTFDMLEAAIAFLRPPPAPFLASSSMLPADRAVRFNVDGRNYVGAAPSFWRQVERNLGPVIFMNVPVWDIDAPSNQAKRKEFTQAMAKSMGIDKTLWSAVWRD